MTAAETNKPAWKAGDVVRLRSGGRRMVVCQPPRAGDETVLLGALGDRGAIWMNVHPDCVVPAGEVRTEVSQQPALRRPSVESLMAMLQMLANPVVTLTASPREAAVQEAKPAENAAPPASESAPDRIKRLKAAMATTMLDFVPFLARPAAWKTAKELVVLATPNARLLEAARNLCDAIENVEGCRRMHGGEMLVCEESGWKGVQEARLLVRSSLAACEAPKP